MLKYRVFLGLSFNLSENSEIIIKKSILNTYGGSSLSTTPTQSCPKREYTLSRFLECVLARVKHSFCRLFPFIFFLFISKNFFARWCNQPCKHSLLQSLLNNTTYQFSCNQHNATLTFISYYHAKKQICFINGFYLLLFIYCFRHDESENVKIFSFNGLDKFLQSKPKTIYF